MALDTELSTTSENPVSSKAIYDVLATKQSAMYFDDVATENSTNFITSGVVYDEIVSATNNVLSNKNNIATALTNAGTPTDSNATFATIIENFTNTEPPSSGSLTWASNSTDILNTYTCTPSTFNVTAMATALGFNITTDSSSNSILYTNDTNNGIYIKQDDSHIEMSVFENGADNTMLMSLYYNLPSDTNCIFQTLIVDDSFAFMPTSNDVDFFKTVIYDKYIKVSDTSVNIYRFSILDAIGGFYIANSMQMNGYEDYTNFVADAVIGMKAYYIENDELYYAENSRTGCVAINTSDVSGTQGGRPDNIVLVSGTSTFIIAEDNGTSFGR